MTEVATSLYSPMPSPPPAVLASPAASSATENASSSSSSGGEDATKDSSVFSFSDLLDAINPLQHIPIVATVYRELTGETISPAARIAGDALYGGLIGLGSGIVDSVVEGETGKDIGSHIMATLFGDDDDSAPAADSSAKLAQSGPDASDAANTPDAAATTAAAANQPTGFFTGLQTGGHHSRFVPLSTTVPLVEVHPGDRAAANTAIAKAQAAQLQAIQEKDASGASAAPAAGASATTPAANAPTPLLPQSTVTPAPFNVGPSAANTPPAPPSNDMIAQMMMQNLDKYKAVASAGPTPAGTAVNSVN